MPILFNKWIFVQVYIFQKGNILTHQNRINFLHSQIQSSIETSQDLQTSKVMPKNTNKSNAEENLICNIVMY